MTMQAGRVADRTFLVECYVPGLPPEAMAEVSLRARRASDALRAEGRRVAYLGAVVVPNDELVFHLFSAADVELVREAAQRAELAVERIVESIVVGRFEPAAALEPVPALGPVPAAFEPRTAVSPRPADRRS